MKAIATTTNGVEYIDDEVSFSDIGKEINILSAENFYESLKSLTDDEVIGCESLLGHYEGKVCDEYGVRKY